jgi:hypothetical protein
LLLPFTTVAHAIVIRDDVPDSSYRVSPGEFPQLVDLPDEGHGTLIAKQWVVTAAHALQGRRPGGVNINGQWRAVAESIVHPDFRMPPREVQVTRGDSATLVAAFRRLHDIALLRLAAPVEDVKAAELYRRSDERGKVATLYGKGATGNGRTGQDANSPHRGQLRRANNRICGADGQWLTYEFDCGSDALPLEGVLGEGDSGGPVLIRQGGLSKLAGVSSWKSWKGNLEDFRAGVCGQRFYSSRISHYAEWIDRVTGLTA